MPTYTYKNFKQACTGSYATAYTCPSATQVIVIHLQATNIHASQTASLYGQWLDSSDSNNAIRFANAIDIPVGASLAPVTGQLALEAGDALQFKANASSYLEISGSVVEIT